MKIILMRDVERAEIDGNMKTEWLEDVAQICTGRHFTEGPLRIVPFDGGGYVKMCRACYERAYPDHKWDELGKC